MNNTYMAEIMQCHKADPEELAKFESAIKTLEKLGYKEHHTALRAGYISRTLLGILFEKKGGRYEGYVIDRPSYKSTNYFYRTYYIKDC